MFFKARFLITKFIISIFFDKIMMIKTTMQHCGINRKTNQHLGSKKTNKFSEFLLSFIEFFDRLND